MKKLLAVLLAFAMALALLPAASAASPVWDGRSSEAYAGGTGTEDDPYLIANGAQLYQLALDGSGFSNTVGLYYKLIGDIDMGNKSFPGIAYFSGTLDGAGHMISNLKIVNTAYDYTGLIQRGSQCTIRNLTINGDVSGKDYVGGIAGGLSNDSIIDNCVNYCKISGNNTIGGICGYCEHTIIQNCQNYGAIYATGSRVAGVCGSAYSSTTIKACYNVGIIDGDSYYAGGICGYSSIYNASGSKHVFISQCANAGNVSSVRWAGGILGEAYCYTDIADCYNCGIVTASDCHAGGIIGYSEENYYYHNGYVPRYSGYNSVTRSYNCGVLNSSEGYTYDPVNDEPNNSYLYYLADINGEAIHPSDAVGLTSDEMTSVGGFAGFDFTTVWSWDNSGLYNYPILRVLGPVLVPCEENAHTWNDGTVLRQATCTDEGELLVTCTKCAMAQNQPIPALGHDVVAGTAVPPTCTESGLTAGGYCSRCDYSVAQQTVAALGHDMVNVPGKQATCTDPGYTSSAYCSRCDHSYEPREIPATGHSWDGGVVTTPPTEEAEGVKTYTCTTCSTTKTESIPVLEHSHKYTAVVTAPTCTEQGYTSYTCTCGDSYKGDFVAALGHNMIIDPAVPATCTETGLTEGSHCSRCDHKVAQQTVSALGHDMITLPGYPATCTQNGLTSGAYCSRCDRVIPQTVIPATGHSWDNGVVTTPPTEETEGVKTYTCTVCNATKTEPIPVLDHVHSYSSVVTAPTCTEQGYTLYTCSCGDSFKENFVDALGHNASDWIVDLAPTCTVAGSMHTECTRCGALLQTSAIQPSGHSESDWIIEKEATCTEGGAKHKECTVCKLRLQTEAIPALGHDYASVVTEPTCTEAGYTTYTCETCGHSYTGDAVPATGHDYENGSCIHCGAEDPDWTEPEDPFVNPFIDVKENDYFYDPVLWAVQKGITNGTTPTTFSPYDPCTRGQIVTFLWRAFGSPEPEKDENPFTDVPENMYYYKAILWAVEQGITTGTSATTFSPEDTCTRGQVATFLWRACGKPAPEGSENPFTDVPETVYYYEPILWAVENGITNGTGNGKFSPEDSCTRGQIVTFLYRALAK